MLAKSARTMVSFSVSLRPVDIARVSAASSNRGESDGQDCCASDHLSIELISRALQSEALRLAAHRLPDADS